MATGRIGVTPTLRTRWSKQPSAGTTSLSGLDDNSVSLVYDVGYEAVYRNGVLLSRGNDYTATSGTSITLIDATLTGDVIEVLANQLVPLNDAISKGQFTAKGALLSATAASTPGVITVGANDTVLTADSTTSTGLKWAAPAAGANWSLLNAGGTALTGAATITVSGISGVDKVFIRIDNTSSASGASAIGVRFNTDSASNYLSAGAYYSARSSLALTLGVAGADNRVSIAEMATNAGSTVYGSVLLTGCNSSGLKQYVALGGASTAASSTDQAGFWLQGIYNSTSTISSISILSSSGNFDSGTVYVYTSA